MPDGDTHAEPSKPAITGLAVRSIFGGVLMGLANLVPGISGGTMLLAAGIYTRFIEAISDVTRLRLRARSLLVLGLVVVSALAAIVLLSGTIKDLVVERRWVMYSLFIGLTLGGAPIVWRMARPATPAVWVGAACGFIAMAVLAVAQSRGVGAGGGGGGASNLALLFLAGVAGASAMILPGVSGAYLLLVLGQYVVILASIDRLKEAARAGDVGAAMGEWTVVVPVGVGVVTGVVVVSNVLRWLLARHEKATLGVLLGLLVGAVVGLWPFQRGVAPAAGDVIKGAVLTAETAPLVDPDDWPTAYFAPTAGQAAGSAGLIAAGLGLTLLIARLGADRRRD